MCSADGWWGYPPADQGSSRKFLSRRGMKHITTDCNRRTFLVGCAGLALAAISTVAGCGGGGGGSSSVGTVGGSQVGSTSNTTTTSTLAPTPTPTPVSTPAPTPLSTPTPTPAPTAQLVFTASGSKTLEEQTLMAGTQVVSARTGVDFRVISIAGVAENWNVDPRQVWRLFYNDVFVLNRTPGTDVPPVGTVVRWDFGNEIPKS